MILKKLNDFQHMLRYSILMALLFPILTSAKVLDIHHWVTSQGTPVYFVETKQVPMLVVDIAFDAGSGRDDFLPGIAFLTNALLNKGNAGLTAKQIAEGFENIGARYGYSVTPDMAILELKTTTENLPEALVNFTKILKPDFPLSAFKQEKKQQQMAIAQNKEIPDAIAQDALYTAIYPHHPYGRPVLGIQASVERIQHQDIKSFYQRYYTARNAVLSLSGDIDLKTAKKIAEQITREIPVGEKAKPLPKALPESKSIQEDISYPSEQTTIELGQVGISRDDPDYFPLMVGNYTLGGGTLVSLLSTEIREKRGLTYNISSYFYPMAAQGPFIVSLATRTEKSKEALQLTKKVLEEFVSHGPSSSELKAAKQFINGNFTLRFETNDAIAEALINMGFYQLPLDNFDTYLSRINAVTSEQVKMAFQKHIHPNQMMIITVGKEPSKDV